MLYSIFMKKTQGDTQPFDISVVINKYLEDFMTDTDIILSLPGYMSRTQTTITNFLSKINFRPYTFFTVGMNGGNNVLSLNPPNTIQNEHNKNFKLKISGLKNTNDDHSKMMFFLENNQQHEEFTIQQISSLNVKAILFGSSNQSYYTYFNNIADKGEADIFLIDGNNFNRNQNNQYDNDAPILSFYNSILEEYRNELEERDLALFKELRASNGDFLNNIFRKTIKTYIE